MQRKTYDYKPERVRAALVDAFKRRKREATVADLVADTALPRVQVEEQLPAVADEYGARLRVTESGEILYSFAGRMRSRYRGPIPALRRALKASGALAAKVLAFLFKIWIMAMLVGYFVLFLALFLLFLVGGTALQAGDRNGRSSRGGYNLVGGILNAFIRIWFYSELFRGPEERYRRAQARAGRRPLHKAVFSFVFGDGDPDADWPKIERKAVLAWLRANSGLISLEEFMILTGRPPEDAAQAINAYCLEFEGSPEASPEGVVYYHFDSIMRGTDIVDADAAARPRARPLAAFSSNPRKANVLFAVINAVNLAFGSFFLWASAAWGPIVGSIIEILANSRNAITRLGLGRAFYGFVVALAAAISADPVALVAVLLGMVPIAFGVLFYLVPLFRSLALKRRNERVKRENLRRIVYAQAWDRPEGLEVPSRELLPAAALPAAPSAPEDLMDELAAYSQAEIRRGERGNVYSFPELARAKKAMARLRASGEAPAFDLGKAIFDSHAPGDA